MTILCITTTGLPGIRPCTHRGQHKITCPDRDVNRAIAAHQHGADKVPDPTCGGCLPRQAERGFLCQRCYELVETAYMRWGRWRRLIDETGGRASSPEGGGAQAEGYSNLPLTMLAIDECERLLKSRADRNLDVWVHDPDGAADAIRFAHAANTAYRTLQVEEQAKRIERVRCPGCGFLTLNQNPTREHRGKTIIECEHCGHVLDEIRLNDTPRWFGSASCETGDHLDCRIRDCRCVCHHLGRASQPQGAHTLFDADQHHTGYVDRADWAIDPDGTLRHRPADERRTT